MPDRSKSCAGRCIRYQRLPVASGRRVRVVLSAKLKIILVLSLMRRPRRDKRSKDLGCESASERAADIYSVVGFIVRVFVRYLRRSARPPLIIAFRWFVTAGSQMIRRYRDVQEDAGERGRSGLAATAGQVYEVSEQRPIAYARWLLSPTIKLRQVCPSGARRTRCVGRGPYIQRDTRH